MLLAKESIKKIKGKNMEQAIPALLGSDAKSKSFESAGSYKMSGASNDKIKVASGKSDKDEEDSSTVVPFINILNQQIYRTDKPVNDKNASPSQGDVTSNELQQPAEGISRSAVMAETDKRQSTFETLLKDVGLSNVNGAKNEQAEAGSADFKPPPAETSAEKDAPFKGQGMDIQSVLKTGDKKMQPEKMLSGEDQLSGSAADKISVNLTELKKENKTDKNILSMASGKEDTATINKLPRTAQEIKESLNSGDNLGQQHWKSANAKVENKSQAEATETITGEAAGKMKAEQKEKIVAGGKGNEDISVNAVNASGGSSAGMEKVNNVSAERIISQITGDIKEAATNDGGRIKIALNPPDLGKLEMDVTVRNGKVEVILVADNKDVQQILNANIDRLKDNLQNQGLTIDRCDVSMQDNQEEYQQNLNRQAFYQEGGSAQDGNDRAENPDEQINAVADTIISGNPGRILRTATDSENISLFA